jgi:nicotinamidase-related amidase
MTDAPSPPRRTALLVIDLQLGMFNGDRIAPIHAGGTLLTRVGLVVSHARRAGMPVIHVRHAGPMGHLLEHGTPNWHIHPSVAPLSGEAIIDKHTPDSFHKTSLMSHLTTAGIDRLIVAGAQTEVCVDTTCRRAFTRGFDVSLVSDGHSTWDNDTLTAEQIIRHTNETLAGWCVRLVHTGDIKDWIHDS